MSLGAESGFLTGAGRSLVDGLVEDELADCFCEEVFPADELLPDVRPLALNPPEVRPPPLNPPVECLFP